MLTNVRRGALALSVALPALFAAAAFFSTATLRAEDKPIIKVGCVGIDNYMVTEFIQHYHNPKDVDELKGIKVVAAYLGESKDIPDSGQSLEKWGVPAMKAQGVEIVDTIDEVVAKSDAIMLMSMDGRSHLPFFKQIVKSGKPVYIGRPLAASLVDVLTIFDLAKEHKAPIFSCSQHRFSPGFIGMRNHPEVGKVLGCSVWGGAQFVPHHQDLFWNGIHSVETLYTIMGPGCETVTRASTPDADFITGVWADGKIGTTRFIHKGAVTYRAMVFGDKGISPSGDYAYDVPEKWVAPHGEYMGYKAVAMEIAKFFRSKEPPISAEETTEIFTYIEAARQSKAKGGLPVKLADVLAEAKKTVAEAKK